jgi:hypothetical protein
MIKIDITDNKIKNRVRGSVNPTNHVKRGIRQVPFPYKKHKESKYLKLSVKK